MIKTITIAAHRVPRTDITIYVLKEGPKRYRVTRIHDSGQHALGSPSFTTEQAARARANTYWTAAVALRNKNELVKN